MTLPVRFEQGTYGLRAVLTSSWSDAIGAEISEREIVEIEINYAKGWKGNEISFLAQFPKLKALKIIDFTIPSVEPIHVLQELLALDVATYCRTPTHFSSFPKLKDCGLEWRSGSESLFKCVTLTNLFINCYKGQDVTGFARLANLESLAILNAPIKTIKGLGALGCLRKLRLANLKSLHSLDGIQDLITLEELEIHTCRGIASIEEIGRLFRLKTLYLNNDGNIASFKPLDKIKNLESVIFYESTNIVDGDLSPLTRQKNLIQISFQNRRHYSHKREEFGPAYYGQT
jgi:hypothetical protein